MDTLTLSLCAVCKLPIPAESLIAGMCSVCCREEQARDMEEINPWQEHYARRAAVYSSDFLDHDHSMDY